MEEPLPFLINDADNHFVEPLDVYERYIEPRWRDKAVRWVKDANGELVQLFAGRPSKTRLSRDSAPENEAEHGLVDGLGRQVPLCLVVLDVDMLPGMVRDRVRKHALHVRLLHPVGRL